MADDLKVSVDYKEVNQATGAVNKLGGALSRSAGQQGKLTKRSKKFTMGIQQAGFQVGDFAAQVQNGTSAMVALGQQGPQLLGVLGVWGALAGAALAIGTAIIKAKNAGKELKFDFKGIGRDLGKLFEPAKPFFDKIGGGFKFIGGLFKGFLNGLITGMAKYFTILSYLPQIIRESFSRAGLSFKKLVASFQVGLQNINVYFTNLQIDLKEGFYGSMLSLRRIVAGSIASVKAGFLGLKDNVVTIFTNMKDIIGNLFKKLGNLVLIPINKTIEAINKLKGFFGGEGMSLIKNFTVDDIDPEPLRNVGKAMAKAYYEGASSVASSAPDIFNEEKMLEKFEGNLAKAKEALAVINAELAKPVTGVKDLKAALEKVGEFDLGKYFSFGVKEAKKNLKDLKSDAEKARDALASSMESAMMDLVNGTKTVAQAFKSMASEVIRELYRIYVVKKITGMVTGALEKSDVPLFSGKANGGPVQGGGRYLVGERGPEIFTPSSSGNITPNSKMSGGAGVTVVQNINVTTGVQQTVRSEIRQLMPQIAASAKGAVLDAKRRGGSYGSSFA